MVFARSYDNVVFIAVVPFLQFADGFQCYEIHAVLVGTENPLGFYGYLHAVYSLFLFYRRTVLYG